VIILAVKCAASQQTMELSKEIGYVILAVFLDVSNAKICKIARYAEKAIIFISQDAISAPHSALPAFLHLTAQLASIITI
jgi:hypothetical protein